MDPVQNLCRCGSRTDPRKWPFLMSICPACMTSYRMTFKPEAVPEKRAYREDL